MSSLLFIDPELDSLLLEVSSPIPKKDRLKPVVTAVVKKVYVVEFFDIYGRRRRKNKLTQRAANILIFKRQFINKYAPYDKSFFKFVQTDIDDGYSTYGNNTWDYKRVKNRWLRFRKYLRQKQNETN
jgi:hypothetical protein